jgi:hypothetical protein
VDCSKKTCLNNCSGRGFCNTGKCYCRPGFEGEDCSNKSKSDDYINCSISCVNNCIEECHIEEFQCFLSCNRTCTTKCDHPNGSEISNLEQRIISNTNLGKK